MGAKESVVDWLSDEIDKGKVMRGKTRENLPVWLAPLFSWRIRWYGMDFLNDMEVDFFFSVSERCC